MKRGQVFVRALNKHEEWATVDVLDLDDESFKVFVIEKLFQHKLIYGLVTDEGEAIVLRERKE